MKTIELYAQGKMQQLKHRMRFLKISAYRISINRKLFHSSKEQQ